MELQRIIDDHLREIERIKHRSYLSDLRYIDELRENKKKLSGTSFPDEAFEAAAALYIETNHHYINLLFILNILSGPMHPQRIDDLTCRIKKLNIEIDEKLDKKKAKEMRKKILKFYPPELAGANRKQTCINLMK